MKRIVREGVNERRNRRNAFKGEREVNDGDDMSSRLQFMRSKSDPLLSESLIKETRDCSHSFDSVTFSESGRKINQDISIQQIAEHFRRITFVV